LAAYFKNIETPIEEITPFMANMYLAEDRILCFEVIARKNKAWTLEFVRGATAETDVPETLCDLTNQRRRWLNGALFAMLYSIAQFPRVLTESSHSKIRKLALCILFFFFCLQIFLSWFLLATFYLAIELVVSNVIHPYFYMVWNYSRYLYMFLTVVQFILGLSSRVKDREIIYNICMVLYGVVIYITLVGLFYQIGTQLLTATYVLWVGIIGTLGFYLIAGLLHWEIGPIMGSLLQYFFMLPTFINIFTIRSFCNMHDISWGTKGVENAHVNVVTDAPGGKNLLSSKNSEPLTVEQKQALELAEAKARAPDLTDVKAFQEQEFLVWRTSVVLAWVCTNILFVMLILQFQLGSQYMLIVFGIVCFYNGVRLIGSVVFWLEPHKKPQRKPMGHRRRGSHGGSGDATHLVQKPPGSAQIKYEPVRVEIGKPEVRG
jgi:chitin synthase